MWWSAVFGEYSDFPGRELSRRENDVLELAARGRLAWPEAGRDLAASRQRSQRGLRLDENHQCLGRHAIMGHRLGGRRALHDGVQRIHVRHIHHHSHPLRVLRIHERPDVGDAKWSEQLLSLRRAQPMILTLCDVVISNDSWKRFGRAARVSAECPELIGAMFRRQAMRRLTG